MKAVIATKNDMKVLSAKRALEYYYKDIEVIKINVKSDVSNQPINEEIYTGVKNRIFYLRRYCKENSIEADLFLAIESGISNQLGEWEIISIAKIEDNNGNSSFANTTGFSISEENIDNIIKYGVEYVMKDIFNNNNKNGGIELLTDGVFNRIDWMEQAFIMALIKIIHKEI